MGNTNCNHFKDFTNDHYNETFESLKQGLIHSSLTMSDDDFEVLKSLCEKLGM